MNIMVTETTGLEETNLVLGLSHLQHHAPPSERCQSRIPTYVAMTPSSNVEKTECCQDDYVSGDRKSVPSSLTSPKRLWKWRNPLSPNPPSEGRKRHQRSNSRSRSWRRGLRRSSSNQQQQQANNVRGEDNHNSEISDISETEQDLNNHCLLVEADLRDPAVPMGDEQARDNSNSTSWSIQVLDDAIEVARISAKREVTKVLWFRIYFHRENDYVYYQGTEILDYVRDLVELDGSFVFSVTIMSTGSELITEASKILEVLRQIIDSATNNQQGMSGLVPSSSNSTGVDNIHALSPVE
jgi:hypothetical protein